MEGGPFDGRLPIPCLQPFGLSGKEGQGIKRDLTMELGREGQVKQRRKKGGEVALVALEGHALTHPCADEHRRHFSRHGLR
jgi:hypothetical protein